MNPFEIDTRVHVYNGAAALARSATTVSVNGLSPASFVTEAWSAMREALAKFIEAPE